MRRAFIGTCCGAVEIEERSFVAKGAPLVDGQKRIRDGDTCKPSRIVRSRSFAALRMTSRICELGKKRGSKRDPSSARVSIRASVGMTA
jgi:hypothetical protein